MSLRALLRRKKDSRLDDKRQTLIFDAEIYVNIQLEMPEVKEKRAEEEEEALDQKAEEEAAKQRIHQVARRSMEEFNQSKGGAGGRECSQSKGENFVNNTGSSFGGYVNI